VPEGTEEAEFLGDEAQVPEHLMPPAGVPNPNLAHVPALRQQSYPIPEPPGDPLEDTNPGVITTISQINQLEPASPAISLLNYTCVLVPRLPQHFLTGELADRLAQWLAQLCLAYGWRLEGIAVRPEYMQWSVQVAPAVSPGNLVRIIRQRTSFYIFNAFAHLGTDNPSGDFWATGYLIVSGPQPPSAQLLRDYISQTRKRQGITR
jgi:REP element-mobilizing transposase RayT